MVASDIISAIAALISAIALWVSYRAFTHKKVVRFDEKLMDLRVRIVEMSNKALIMQLRITLMQKISPEDTDKELQDHIDALVRKCDDLHRAMFKKPADWDEKFVNDLLVEIRRVEGEMNRILEQVEALFKKV